MGRRLHRGDEVEPGAPEARRRQAAGRQGHGQAARLHHRPSLPRHPRGRPGRGLQAPLERRLHRLQRGQQPQRHLAQLDEPDRRRSDVDPGRDVPLLRRTAEEVSPGRESGEPARAVPRPDARTGRSAGHRGTVVALQGPGEGGYARSRPPTAPTASSAPISARTTGSSSTASPRTSPGRSSRIAMGCG